MLPLTRTIIESATPLKDGGGESGGGGGGAGAEPLNLFGEEREREG